MILSHCPRITISTFDFVFRSILLFLISAIKSCINLINMLKLYIYETTCIEITLTHYIASWALLSISRLSWESNVSTDCTCCIAKLLKSTIHYRYNTDFTTGLCLWCLTPLSIDYTTDASYYIGEGLAIFTLVFLCGFVLFELLFLFCCLINLGRDCIVWNGFVMLIIIYGVQDTYS